MTPPYGELPGLLARVLFLFYAEFGFAAGLLLLQINTLVFVADDGGANLRGSFAQLCQLVGEEVLLGAVGTLSRVRGLIATVQAGVAQGAVAAAVAGKLVDHTADLDCLLMAMHLPRVAEMLAGELFAEENRRQGA